MAIPRGSSGRDYGLGSMGRPPMASAVEIARALGRVRYARYVLYVLAGALLLWLFRSRGGPELGANAPHIDLPLVGEGHGARINSGAAPGKPKLIEVFASWCGSCRRAAPLLSAAHATYKEEVDFLGVSVDASDTAAGQVKHTWQIPYPVAHDDRGAFAQSYRIRVLPTFVLIDKNGRIQQVTSGMPSRKRLDEWLTSLTERQSLASP
jgi:thiol-disulfide isomerase/thioredoxin